MTRLTRISDNNEAYIVDDGKVDHDVNGYSGDAINKLAKFENIYDDLVANQREISKELEGLRNEGKMHSTKFRELMVKKLTNSNVITLFKAYDL